MPSLVTMKSGHQFVTTHSATTLKHLKRGKQTIVVAGEKGEKFAVDCSHIKRVASVPIPTT